MLSIVGGLEAEMRAVTIKALEKFWSITQMPMDEDNKTIVARSFAYIGHILTKRESLVRSEEQTIAVFQRNSSIPERSTISS
jgi:hypothetical protein